MTVNAQESFLQVKFKNAQIRNTFEANPNSLSSLRASSNDQTLDLVPSYPNAKTPELELYYDVVVSGDKQ
jgi:hypothetical protein